MANDLFESLLAQKIKIKETIDDKKNILKNLCDCLEINLSTQKQYQNYERFTQVGLAYISKTTICI